MDAPGNDITSVTNKGGRFLAAIPASSFSHPTPLLSHSLPPSTVLSLGIREWSECEPTIVEINGIWNACNKEGQSLDSKWAKRVVRTWAVLVVRKGWSEGETQRWREVRRPLAVCSRTKCWIMRSDWHDPVPELRETASPFHFTFCLYNISFHLIPFVLHMFSLCSSH